MKTTINPITPVDYGEVAEISNRAHAFMLKHYTRKEKKTLGREETAETIADQLQDRLGVVAENEHKRVLGFVLWHRYESVAWIVNIAVDPLYQRQGIGRSLLRYVEGWAEDQDLNAVMFEVHNRNQKAKEFYESYGYEPLSEAVIEEDYALPPAKPFVGDQTAYGKRL